MKNTLFRTAIVAAFAVMLLTGSALAEQITGYAAFNLKAEGVYSTDNSATLIGVKFLPYTGFGVNGALSSLQGPPLGIFDEFYTGGQHLSDFPMDNNLFFRDEVTFDLMDNIVNGDGEIGHIGDFAGFALKTDAITNGAETPVPVITAVDGYNKGFVLKLLGGLNGNGYDLPASYMFTFNQTSATQKFWEVQLTVETPPSDNIPDVPEPGTLVLLGTGLLGAAAIARRKIRK